jgi:hypothetical protein
LNATLSPIAAREFKKELALTNMPRQAAKQALSSSSLLLLLLFRDAESFAP